MRAKDISRLGTIILFVAMFCSGIFWRCATIQQAPEGGPRDTIPPKLVRATPAENSVNFNQKQITLEFDEYVQLKDQQKEFFTSPFMPRKPILTLKGKGVLVDLKSDLDSNTTYVLNFGQSVVDNNEGNPYVGLTYTFSTGKAIDSLIMSGYASKAQTSDTVKNAYVLFFDARDVADTPYDSTIFKQSAKAVGKTMPNGIFIHEHLKPIDYKIYALVDNNGNQTYEPGVDEVAFMDSLYNPSKMPEFRMWYDSIMMYRVADPQIYLRTFKEIPPRRNNLASHTRPEGQRLMLKFSGEFPIIDTFEIKGIDSSLIIREYAKPTRDSIFYWLNVPADQLPDTLKARIAYERHDSIGNLYTYGQNLDFIFKKPVVKESKEERKEAAAKEKKDKKSKRKGRKKQEEMQADSAAFDMTDSLAMSLTDGDLNPNEEGNDKAPTDTTKREPLKITTDLKDDFKPIAPAVFTFEYPLTHIDISKAKLTRTDIKGAKFNTPFTFVRDTMNLRKYTLNAHWRTGDKYELIIPDSAFMDIAGNVSDTLKKVFAVADEAKFATVTVNMTNADTTSNYIIEVLDASGKKVLGQMIIDGRKPNGSIPFIEPGEVMIRVTEDRNRNGVWDTGDVVKRRQPERVAIFENPKDDGNPLLLTKANWDIDYPIDVTELFRQKYRHVSRKRVLPAEKKPTPNQQQNNNNGMGGTGGFGGFGGGGQTLQRQNMNR